ncbi:MAG: hypothetical protein FJ304_16320 [Planctomycetes bacterium]|nr:hypothetical protein [Planctomycetota bacterium]
MDETPTPVELFTLILVSAVLMPRAAWADLRAQLAPPGPAVPALGIEFAPAELTEADIEATLTRVRELESQYPQRQRERAANPLPAAETALLTEAARARLVALVRDLPNFGIQIVAEVDPRDTEYHADDAE